MNSFLSGKRLLANIISLILLLPNLLLAEPDEAQIRAVRDASNAALAQLDEELNMTFMTDDAFITTSSGALLAGKADLREYIAKFANDRPMYWVRTPLEIIVNADKGAAWEQGVWRAYWADDKTMDNPLNHGKYSAHWTKANDIWLIKSQLFVGFK